MILTKGKQMNTESIYKTEKSVAKLKRWYIVLVRMHHERKVSEYLTKIGIENFVPIQQETHQWSDRRKTVEAIIFPMMVFVYVSPKERAEVLDLSIVRGYMVFHGESNPVVVPDEQMTRFRFMLDCSEDRVCLSSYPMARGKKVCVIDGPLKGLIGEFVNLDDKTQIVVRLNMLGCACVDMPVKWVVFMEN